MSPHRLTALRIAATEGAVSKARLLEMGWDIRTVSKVLNWLAYQDFDKGGWIDKGGNITEMGRKALENYDKQGHQYDTPKGYSNDWYEQAERADRRKKKGKTLMKKTLGLFLSPHTPTPKKKQE